MKFVRFYFLGLFIFSLHLPTQASKVLLHTNYGDIEVVLFDEITPITVENFLRYAENLDYDGTLIHRLITGFVMQGGGYRLNENALAVKIPTYGSIQNEPFLSNIKGTIAMAKLGDETHSATSEWFINLTDNSANLDVQNAGFSVFGQVTDNSLAVLDAISAISIFNFDSPFNSLPLDNYTLASDESSNIIPPSADQFVLINSISITDSDPASSNNLNPVQNTLNTSQKSNSAGSLSIWMLIMAFILFVFRPAQAVHKG